MLAVLLLPHLIRDDSVANIVPAAKAPVVAVVRPSGQVDVYNVRDGRKLSTLPPGTTDGDEGHFALSPDGSVILTAAEYKKFSLWSVTPPTKLRTIVLPQGSSSPGVVAWTASNPLVLYRDKTSWLDLKSGTIVPYAPPRRPKLKSPTMLSDEVVYSKDGRLAAAPSWLSKEPFQPSPKGIEGAPSESFYRQQHGFRVWDLRTGASILRPTPVEDQYGIDLVFTKRGDILVLGIQEDYVGLFRRGNWKAAKSLKRPGYLYAPMPHTDFIVIGDHKTLTVYSANDLRLVRRIPLG
jgi:hypothetical protein